MPPGPEPKQLTAKSPMRTLLEHQLAFINANNKKGFVETDYLNEEQIEGIAKDLLSIAKLNMVDIRDINRIVRKSTYEVMGPDGLTQTKHAITFKTIARLLGYTGRSALNYYANMEGFIANRRNADSAQTQIFQPNQDALRSLIRKPPNRALQEQFNKILSASNSTLTEEEKHRCEVLAYCLYRLDNVKGISLFRKNDLPIKRERITFDKECDAYKQYATEALKDLVDWIWAEIGELVYIRHPTTGEALVINLNVVSFLEEAHGIFITKGYRFDIRNLNVTITLKNIRFAFIAS